MSHKSVSAHLALLGEPQLSSLRCLWQALMLAETVNNVFGTTVNPFNARLTCGGSSGGEGALLALRGSPLGVGSDLGGSKFFPLRKERC